MLTDHGRLVNCPSELSLLFEETARPDAATIYALAAASGGFAVSHDPRKTGDGNWLELLIDGFTFDLRGLAPGNCEMLQLHPNGFDLPTGFNPFRYSALTLLPGAHLTGGAAMIPVVRRQMGIGARLCELPGLAAVGWLPARTLSGPAHFRRSIAVWLAGGSFPGFGLTALLNVPDGGMQSEGLSFFTGQELRIEPDLAIDGPRAARIALCLIGELIERGPVKRFERSIGPAGESLRLDPSPNKRFVRVSGL